MVSEKRNDSNRKFACIIRYPELLLFVEDVIDVLLRVLLPGIAYFWVPFVDYCIFDGYDDTGEVLWHNRFFPNSVCRLLSQEPM